MSNVIAILISSVLITLRVLGLTSDVLNYATHLFIGGLLGAVWAQINAIETEGEHERLWPRAKFNFGLAVVLSIVELGCFLAFRYFGGH